MPIEVYQQIVNIIELKIVPLWKVDNLVINWLDIVDNKPDVSRHYIVILTTYLVNKYTGCDAYKPKSTC